MAIDADNQAIILGCIPSPGYLYDCRFFALLTERLEAEHFVADKGYDSMENIKRILAKDAKPLTVIKDNMKTGI